MPELPEVETIKLGLQKKIIGLRVKSVEILNPGSFHGDPNDLIDQSVTNVFRRAKILGIELGNNQVILFHLKMSGQIIWQAGSGMGEAESIRGGHPTKDMFSYMPNSSTRVIFEFSDESKLFFNDQRKFGWVKISGKGEAGSVKFFEKLGPEPLEKEFTWQILKTQILKRMNTPIKVALLDQELIAGIGNIYASEACFIARINPTRRVSSLSDQDFKSLHKGVIKTLSDGIKYGGSSKTHYLNIEGGKGTFLDYAFVYDRTGEPCKICRGVIEKITLGGRGTYLCSVCQADTVTD